MRIAAGLLSLTVLVTSGVAWSLYQSFVADVRTITLSPPVDQDGRPAADLDGPDQNILLVGDDSRVGATAAELAELGTTEDGVSENTDTMMLLHIPADGRAASVLSLPRDSWVDVRGFGMNKLNAAYALGALGGDPSAGASLLAQAVYDITGLSVDHFVMIGMLGFLRIANALGGVNLCLNEAHNASTEGDASHPGGYSGIDLQQGWNYDVKGTQAIAFVRQRHGLPRGDIDRIARQQYFLAAAFRKVKSAGTLLNPFKVQGLMTAVSSSLTVDKGLAGSGMLDLASTFANLSAGSLSFATIPNDGGSSTEDGLSVVQIDRAALPGFLAGFLGQSTAYANAQPARPASVSVEVIDDTSGYGADQRAVAALEALGFAAHAASSPAVSGATTIQYPPGMEAAAKALAAVVPGAAVSASSAVSAVTLLLGDDGIGVAGPGGSGGGGGSAGSGGGGSGGGGSGGGGAPSPAGPGPAAVAGARTADTADCVN
jgi:LCP family protein required for cell wall assembly